MNSNDKVSLSNFPLGIQFVLLLFLALLFSILGNVLVQLLETYLNLDYFTVIRELDEASSNREKNFIRAGLSISQLCTFFLPALAFLWIAHKHNWLLFSKLSTIPSSKKIVLGIFFLLFSFPIAQWLLALNRELPLPTWANEQETLINNVLMQLLQVKHPSELFLNVLVIGLVPAIGEELFFRGIIQQKLENYWQNTAMAIFVTASIFSAIHLQFQGFLPRLLLGLCLGYIFVWTNSLWVPILAHFVLNSSQVVLSYLADKQGIDFNMESMEAVEIPIWLIMICLFFMMIIGKALHAMAISTPPPTP